MANESKAVEFEVDGRTVRGHLVAPEGEGKRPGLIVIHEWWGLNDHVKDIANRFANEGFAVLAPDLYGGAIAKDAEGAGRLMQGLDQERALRILDGAVEHLKQQDNVDAGRIGVTGFCMGGSYALLFAARNGEIKASAPFYGDVPADDALKDLRAPVLFIGADQDNWITPDKMNRLSSAIAKYGKEGEVKIYKGVGHAFFNDTRPEVYDEEAAKDAWKRVVAFLKEKLS